VQVSRSSTSREAACHCARSEVHHCSAGLKASGPIAALLVGTRDTPRGRAAEDAENTVGNEPRHRLRYRVEEADLGVGNELDHRDARRVEDADRSSLCTYPQVQ
jgi:hypothetical protein